MDYYKILGVNTDASEKEIHKAYIKLARQYHPDINPGDNVSLEKMKLINEAYEVLGSREKRKAYNNEMNFSASKVYADYEEDADAYKREAEELWKKVERYYNESCASNRGVGKGIINVKYRFPFFMTLPFIWIVAISYMPYSIVGAILLDLSRYVELGENNIRQKKSTMISLLMLLIMGLMFWIVKQKIASIAVCI